MIYLVDNSVLQRMRLPAVRNATESLVDADGELACCAVTLDEAGYGARNAADLVEIWRRLLGDFRFLEQDRESDRAVAEIRETLFVAGMGRAAGTRGLLIAAVAIRHGATVLHYDADFTHIADVDARLHQRWVVERGTVP